MTLFLERNVKSMEKIFEALLNFLPTLGFASLILIIGTIISNLVLKIMSRGLERGSIDKTAHGFLKSLVRIVLYTLVFVIVLTVLGVPMTSIIAVIGASALAVGLALQSSLSNLAGGFIILFEKPFKVGDYIESNDVSGTVDSISILYTRLLTPDNKAAFIPNGAVAESKIINYTDMPVRRVDLEFSISYQSDFEEAKKAILSVVESCSTALETPEPIVRLGRHGEDALIIYTRVWSNASDYWATYFYLNEAVRIALDEKGMEFPHKKLDIYLSREA